MSSVVKFTINGKECMGEKGTYLVQAAKENGIYIPTLCNYEGIKPRGSCRICTVKINNRLMTSCTTKITEGMVIETNTDELNEYRKMIIEILFVEGNHFCPSCERSGNCELQALGYRFKVLAPRFDYQFQKRGIDASNPKLIKDHNRCILCKRCIRGIKDEEGRNIFAFRKRGYHVEITLDTELAQNISDELALKAMKICPVGALIKKEIGFIEPIGTRQYDKKPIGSEIESSV